MLAERLADTIFPLGQGFLLYASLIMVVGPQNLFVLKQGLRRRHLFVTATFCTLADFFLTGFAVGGLGVVISDSQKLTFITTLGGALFLTYCGVRSLGAAWCFRPLTGDGKDHLVPLSISLKGTVIVTLSFALLNPAAYVDTLLIVGTASAQYPTEKRTLFGAGAVLASGLWFFTLTYGSSRLSPLLQHPKAWRALDIISGSIMISMACYLLA